MSQPRFVGRYVTRRAIREYLESLDVEKDAYAALADCDHDDPRIDQLQNWADISCSVACDAKSNLLRCVLAWEATEHHWAFPSNKRHFPNRGLIANGMLFIAHVNSEVAGLDTEGQDLPHASNDAMQLAVIPLANIFRFDGDGGL